MDCERRLRCRAEIRKGPVGSLFAEMHVMSLYFDRTQIPSIDCCLPRPGCLLVVDPETHHPDIEPIQGLFALLFLVLLDAHRDLCYREGPQSRPLPR